MKKTILARVALRLLATAALPCGGGAASEAPKEPALEACAQQMAEVTAALAAEPPLRDEAYTAIMWGRMDAQAAYAAADGPACLSALDFPRRALGLRPPDAAGEQER